ncbi:MAG: prolipoprotein diacylglyceryl transferase [Candidatus Cloacimonetes bacterium]|nr:prolipoprotein diacylglyceryl transferase [Candidatus Cloacimonadota bacterium]
MKYPDINPSIIKFGSLDIRWYGFLYIVGFLIGYIFLRKLLKYRNIHLKKDEYENMLFRIMLGIIIGGRLGYILFYNLSYYFIHPLDILKVWEGGMSFHGGAIAVIILGYFFCKKHKLSFLQLADPVLPLASIGIGLGRLGNFINAELYGRVTNVPWAMIFPTDPQKLPRHPSQLYEIFLEGIVLFVVSFLMLRKISKPGIVFWTWIGLYGLFRFLVEFVREPDTQLGFILGPLTMGQVLSLFMIISGIIALILLNRKSKNANL